MYTWGSSPQALRLANQIKRRANAKQKIEEHQRREMSKRFEDTISNKTFKDEDFTPIEQNVASTTNASSSSTAKSAENNVLSGCPGSSCGMFSNKNTVDEDAVKENEDDAVVSAISIEVIDDVVGEVIQKAMPLKENPTVRTQELSNNMEQKNIEHIKQKSPQPPPLNETDPSEHMTPHLVDTSEVAGQIKQVSSISSQLCKGGVWVYYLYCF